MSEKILLESGTNEMEMLIFRIGDTKFGINVSKVREIIEPLPIAKIPQSPDAVEGSFQLRDKLLSLVNLVKHFKMNSEDHDMKNCLVIIVEFNNQSYGMLVDAVDRIHRLKWSQIDPPSDFLNGHSVPLTGITQVEGQTILIADLENIFQEIFGEIDTSGTQEFSKTENGLSNARIIVAEDSGTIRKILSTHLKGFGFKEFVICPDGQDAWETIQSRLKEKKEPFDLVITDIEMPRMDGLHLTSLIKKHPELKNTPVILFSSLISEDNKNKGEAVGADAQVTKFQSGELLETIEKCLKKTA